MLCCYVVLFYATSRYVTLRDVMLCYVMLCYVLLCFTVGSEANTWLKEDKKNETTADLFP